MRQKPGVVVVFVFALLLAAPGLARAEWFIDPYLGAAFTMEDDLDFSATAPGVTLDGKFRDLDFEDSLLLGIRGGYWFPSAPNIGIALDVFYFEPEIKSQTTTLTSTAAVTVGDTLVVAAGTGPANLGSLDVEVIGLSADFMLRMKLSESPDFPNGQIQPYAFVGPALFFIDAEDETDTNVGLKTGAGINWMFTKNFGLFVEYRFTHTEVELEDTSGGSVLKAETDLSTHSVLGGISFRF